MVKKKKIKKIWHPIEFMGAFMGWCDESGLQIVTNCELCTELFNESNGKLIEIDNADEYMYAYSCLEFDSMEADISPMCLYKCGNAYVCLYDDLEFGDCDYNEDIDE